MISSIFHDFVEFAHFQNMPEFSGIIYRDIICVFDVKTMVFDKFQNFLELYTHI